MSLDIRVVRTRGPQAPTKLPLSSRPVPPAPPPPPPPPAPPAKKPKSGKGWGRILWWLLLLILLAALAFLVYLIWNDSKQSAEMTETGEPIVSTFATPSRPQTETNAPVAELPLAEQLSNLSAHFNQLIDPEKTEPAEQVAGLQNDLMVWFGLQQKFVDYFADLKVKVTNATSSQTENIQAIGQALEETKSELDIAQVALSADKEEASPSSVAEAIRAITAARAQLEQALPMMVDLENRLNNIIASAEAEIAESDNQAIVEDEMATNTPTTTEVVATTTDTVVTTTSSTTP